MSPDLNPIEHVWDMFDRRVRKRPAAPLTLQELADALIKEWPNLPHDALRSVVRSVSGCNQCPSRTYTSLELDGAASLELMHTANF
jgi:hypothetical protein